MGIHEHAWGAINGSMDTQGLSLMGLWIFMDMFGLHQWVHGHPEAVINGTVDMFGIPLMNMNMH